MSAWTYVDENDLVAIQPSSRLAKRVRREMYKQVSRKRCRYRKAAQARAIEGTLEVDDDALVSISDDTGAYVQAWVWVDKADLNPVA